jgi:hypothetical protein
MTWRPEHQISNHIFGAVTGVSASGIGVFGSKAECDSFRSTYGVDLLDASLCASVATVELPAIDKASVPSGSGWYCLNKELPLDPGSSHPSCFRSSEDCETVARYEYSDGSGYSCVRRNVAYVFTAAETSPAFSGQGVCRETAMTAESASRCEAIH